MLGYDLSTVDNFMDEIIRRLPDFRAIYKNSNEFGDKYEVRIMVDGTEGRKQGIITVWMYDIVDGVTNDFPRCANVIFDDIRRQRP